MIRSPLFLAAIGSLGLGCTPSAEPSPDPGPDPCRLVAGPPTLPLDAVVIGGDEVSPPRVLDPRSPGDRLAFHLLYETLVRVDCQGTLRPGLAAEWSSPDGRVWTLGIRPDGRFWDLTPVDAPSVIRAWADADLLSTGEVHRDSVSAPAPDEVRIALDRPDPRFPARLADPSLAVLGPILPNGWPVGTRVFRPVERSESAGGAWLIDGPGGVSGRWTLLVSAHSADVRDRLDAGVALLVTADRPTLDYARGRAEYTLHALPWDRTVVLVPGRFAADSASAPDSSWADFLRSLARDAMRVDARRAVPVEWWLEASACRVSDPPRSVRVDPRLATSRVVYPAADTVAADVAGRLVATWRQSAGNATWAAHRVGAERARDASAVGLDSAAFALALEAGHELGYVHTMPRHDPAPCRSAAAWMGRAPWAARTAGIDWVVRTNEWIALVDTRQHAVVHRDARGFTVGADGLPQPVRP